MQSQHHMEHILSPHNRSDWERNSVSEPRQEDECHHGLGLHKLVVAAATPDALQGAEEYGEAHEL